MDDSEKPSWSVLREDFMLRAKMKDWDKDEDSPESEEEAVCGISKKGKLEK